MESKCMSFLGFLKSLIFFFHIIYPFSHFVRLILSPYIFFFPLCLLFNLSSCFVHRFVARRFLCCSDMFCFVCITWFCPDISLVIFTYPSSRAVYDTRSIFKQSLTGLKSELSFSWTSCLTKAEEPSLPYYLPIAGGRIIGFIPFPRVLVLCEMLSVSSRIWTRVAVSIFFDTTVTSNTSWSLISLHFSIPYSLFLPVILSDLSAEIFIYIFKF